MLKEKASVSKWEDHIFDVGVADLSPLSGARADVVQGSWLWCMSGPAFRAFHDRLLFFSMWNMGLGRLFLYFSIWKRRFHIERLCS